MVKCFYKQPYKLSCLNTFISTPRHSTCLPHFALPASSFLGVGHSCSISELLQNHFSTWLNLSVSLKKLCLIWDLIGQHVSCLQWWWADMTVMGLLIWLDEENRWLASYIIVDTVSVRVVCCAWELWHVVSEMTEKEPYTSCRWWHVTWLYLLSIVAYRPKTPQGPVVGVCVVIVWQSW